MQPCAAVGVGARGPTSTSHKSRPPARSTPARRTPAGIYTRAKMHRHAVRHLTRSVLGVSRGRACALAVALHSFPSIAGPTSAAGRARVAGGSLGIHAMASTGAAIMDVTFFVADDT